MLATNKALSNLNWRHSLTILVMVFGALAILTAKPAQACSMGNMPCCCHTLPCNQCATAGHATGNVNSSQCHGTCCVMPQSGAPVSPLLVPGYVPIPAISLLPGTQVSLSFASLGVPALIRNLDLASTIIADARTSRAPPVLR